MSNMKLQTLKGFRDFLPREAKKRQYVIRQLADVFESYGFDPLETPALEYEEVLLGKYGDEGDKLMYRFKDLGGRNVAMRYDQTVPLARVVAQYQNQLPFPFKRYQIQPVWRAENPQRGRFREFLQCDADVVGIYSETADAEILGMVYDAYKKLKLDVVIKINDRALLKEISTRALPVLDKLNKIGEEGVKKELGEKGFTFEEANNLLKQARSFQQSLYLRKVMDIYEQVGHPKESWSFDPTLVRGLDYYTGMIFEVVLKSAQNSPSLCGGGRYDNLIGMFAGRKIPAVGFAIGFDRTIEAMNELNLFPEELITTKVLVTIFSPDFLNNSLEISSRLRSNNINTELYLDANTKMDKQLKYADQKGIPYVIIIGPEEEEKGMVSVRNMKTREQKQVEIEELTGLLSDK